MSSLCQMIPTVLPERIRSNPKRRSECAVYDALYENLADKKFHVFYSKEWLNHQFDDVEQEDGECDFIVAHPEFGLLFIEVKGGLIRLDAETNQWYSGKYTIRNPIWQARTSKHFVRQALRERWGDSMPFIKMVHCVLLPNSSNRARYLGEGLPVEIFGFMEDMGTALPRRIYAFYDFETANDTRISGKLGTTGINHLRDMFAKDLDFAPRLRNKISDQAYLIERKTKEQQKLINILKNSKNALIEGPAGSGKTMLAVETALQEAASDEEKQILFICFNSPLRRFITSLVSSCNEQIHVHTFASLVHHLAVRAGLNIRATFDKDDRSKELESLAFEAVDILGPSFDVLIVDEGQDLTKNWWELLEFVVKEPAQRKWVFRDNNQKIYPKRDADYSGLAGPYLLNEVIRNTEEIGSAALNFYGGDSCSLEGPRGDPLQWKASESQKKDLVKIVRRLLGYEGVLISQIAVLSMCGFDKSFLSGMTSVGDYPVRRADDDETDAITVDSVYRFKGLEQDVVILCDFQEGGWDEELLYVGISRAKSYLLFLMSDNSRITELQNIVQRLGR